MFDEVDEALRQLLLRELPIKNNEVDIAFNQPKKDWSARLSRPTVNLYLYDVRENNKLRQPSPAWTAEAHPSKANTVVQRRHPLKVDLHYIVTAWANEPDDEHRLLARTLMVLARTPEFPADLLSDSLQAQPPTIKVAQYDTLDKPSDLWSVMDNQMRPAVPMVILMSLDPFAAQETPLVTTTRLKIGAEETFWIRGSIRSKDNKPLNNLRVTLVDRGLDAVMHDADYVFQRLAAGTYTVEVNADGRKPSRVSINVPSVTYDLEV